MLINFSRSCALALAASLAMTGVALAEEPAADAATQTEAAPEAPADAPAAAESGTPNDASPTTTDNSAGGADSAAPEAEAPPAQ